MPESSENISTENAYSSEEALTDSTVATHNRKSVDTNILWKQSISVLKSQLDPQIFTAWIEPLVLNKFTKTDQATDSNQQNVKICEAELLAPNKFCRDHVERHYGKLISSALSNSTGKNEVVVNFRVEAKDNPMAVVGSWKKRISSKTSPTANRISRRNISKANSSNLNDNYNFSNFVVGKCNQLAHAVSLLVAENPGTRYNPLFLYGGVGLGKTHLANAIGNACRRRSKSVLLVSSEIFVNELISSLRANKMDKFKNKFRSLDVLVIDDIQFLVGKERTQEEFFHTFNDLYHHKKQIVITSDRIPQELVGLEERLRTRFSSGLNADLQPPDFETRVAILAKKADSADINLPSDIAGLLAERIDTNVRELEGALNRLLALSSLQDVPISRNLAEQVLQSCAPKQIQDISPELIQRMVAEKYNVSVKDLLGKRRTQNIAFARHVAMYLCRLTTTCSYPEIGALFGGRDHSTVIHAHRTLEERISSTPSLADEVEALKKKLTG